MARYDYQLAVGHNNAAGLTNVETTIPSYQTHQTFFPRGRGMFDDGILRVRSDGLLYTAGFASFVWEVDVLEYAQWAYLQTTYTTGGNTYSGQVTARTRLIGGTYANYNATMILPKPPDEDKKFVAMRNVEIRFTRAVAL